MRLRLARPVALAFFGALLLVGAPSVVVVVGSMPESMKEVFVRDAVRKIRSVPGERFACDRAARPVAGGARRCVDYRGYRVVLGDKIEVYSLRGAQPQMVFGIEGSMEYDNPAVDPKKLRAQKGEFLQGIAAL